MASKKKKRVEESAGSGLIQMMTVSLFIILLAFFILLNAIARESEDRKLVALGSLAKSFNILSGGYSLFKGGEEGISLDNLTYDSREIDFSGLFVDEDDVKQHIRIRPDKRGSIVRISAELLFDSGQDILKSSGTGHLKRLVTIMRQNEFPIEIMGHTDATPIDVTGRMTNRELSMIRALSVMNYLNKNGRIKLSRMTALGWGQSRPIGSNRTIETRTLNNRIDILFVHKKERYKPKGSFTFKDFFFKALEK